MVYPVFTSSADIESVKAAAARDLRTNISLFLAETDYTVEKLAREVGLGTTALASWLEDAADQDIRFGWSVLYKLHLLGITAPQIHYHWQVGTLDIPERPDTATYPEVHITDLGEAGAIVRLTTDNDLGDEVEVRMTSSCVRALAKALQKFEDKKAEEQNVIFLSLNPSAA